MNNPLVTVIVPTHLNENQSYLDWCLKSILSSVNVDIEVLVYASTKEIPIVPHDSRVHLKWGPELYPNCTAKFHAGVKDASPSSKFVMLISDDVIISKYCIKELADTLGDQLAILGPSSNCDATTRYLTQFSLTVYPDPMDKSSWITRPLGLKSTLEEIKGLEQGVIDYPLAKRILLPLPWISFYCTLFPKAVIEKVGLLNEGLDVRWNDMEYCQRAFRCGIPSLINLGAFAYHAGDRTLPKVTTQEMYHAADEEYKKSCVYI